MSGDDERLSPEKTRRKLRSLLDEVNDALAPHDNIRAGDSQYEDPQEFWLRPLQRQLQEALTTLEINS